MARVTHEGGTPAQDPDTWPVCSQLSPETRGPLWFHPALYEYLCLSFLWRQTLEDLSGFQYYSQE